jgi:enoyl-CoA hydratase/carnithine racemase
MKTYADGALQLATEGPCAWLTLARPKARNAINEAMWKALPEAVADIGRDEAIRVLVVRGAGGHFASGADISEFPKVFANKAAAAQYKLDAEAATKALADVGIPVIALLEGFCIGAGLAIALACDLRIAAAEAKIGAPPAKLGLVYGLTDTRRLVAVVGASAAKAMLFTGALQTAEQARDLGLVNEVHPSEALEEAVRARVANIAALSPWSIRTTKRMVALVLAGAVEDTQQSADWFAEAVEGPDFAEGLAAFHEKRPPVFR